jgi:putative PIG3 family NAD(P)H quinone oxidoreductase
MKAVLIREPGGPEVLHVGRAEKPVPGRGEVLVEVKAAGVNRPDLAQRAGRYPVPADASPIPGLEVAGLVRETGIAVSGMSPGDRVMALVHGGGYAEFCTVDHRHVLPIPEGMGFVEAAAFPEVALTVEFNMVMRAGLGRAESVLIHGGSSGIGSHAIARARSLGAVPITTSRGKAKCDYCIEMGAERAIDSLQEDWPDAVMETTGGRGVDVVLDMVGGDYTARNLACLADDGRYALISLQGGRDVALSLDPVLRRRLTITGSTLRPLSPEIKGLIVEKVRRDVLPLLGEGQMHPHIHRTFDVGDVVDAHRLMESGDHFGKVVLTLQGP